MPERAASRANVVARAFAGRAAPMADSLESRCRKNRRQIRRSRQCAGIAIFHFCISINIEID
ncbi:MULTISPECIES: hypothetical protein [Burkholderia]|nr:MULTISPECIES: hypothetical protein [Burkholderia]